MPGGYKRDYYGEEDEITQVIDAIDRLLAGEFADLEVAKIMEITMTVYEKVRQASIEGMNQVNIDSFADELDMADREKEKLRPLFNRMLQMGFDPAVLTR